VLRVYANYVTTVTHRAGYIIDLIDVTDFSH